MSARIVSAGSGSVRALALAYLVPSAQPPGQPHLDDQIRAALPGACVIAYSDADGELLGAAEERARAAGWVEGPLVLVGYSAGCLRGIRRRLLDGADAAAVVAIDGTHASLPPAGWQIDTWRRIFDDARAGRRLFVATCSQQTYVEHLPAQQRYQATVTTLRQVTGWPLAEAGALPLGVERSEGDAHVHSYQSAAIDGDAHSAQLLTALPEMLRRYLAPWLARQGLGKVTPTPATLPTGAPRTLRRGDSGDDVFAWERRLHELGYDAGALDGRFGPVVEAATIRFQRAAGIAADGYVGPITRGAAARTLTPPPDRPTSPIDADLGAELLEQMRAELRAGVRETDGRNESRRIHEYFTGTGAPPGSAWCAAIVRFCLRDAAAKLRIAAPIEGSVGARATMAQLRRAGRFISADDLRAHPGRLQPGWIVVWWRESPDGPFGHEGVVSRVDGRAFSAIEGNSGAAGDRVAEMQHDIDESRLLGAGWVS